MNKSASIVVVVIILLVIIGIVVYSKNDATVDTVSEGTEMTSDVNTNDNGINADNTIGTSTSIEAGGSIGAPSIKSFTVSGTSYAFSPTTMVVNKGDTVRITFKNTSGFHAFAVKGYDVETEKIQAGGEATVEFVANTAGTFEYYCPVGEHEEMGMKGTLTVI